MLFESRNVLSNYWQDTNTVPGMSSISWVCAWLWKAQIKSWGLRGSFSALAATLFWNFSSSVNLRPLSSRSCPIGILCASSEKFWRNRVLKNCGERGAISSGVFDRKISKPLAWLSHWLFLVTGIKQWMLWWTSDCSKSQCYSLLIWPGWCPL